MTSSVSATAVSIIYREVMTCDGASSDHRLALAVLASPVRGLGLGLGLGLLWLGLGLGLLHARMPSNHVCSNFESPPPLPPHLPNQAPPRLQQLSLPDLFAPHLLGLGLELGLKLGLELGSGSGLGVGLGLGF